VVKISKLQNFKSEDSKMKTFKTEQFQYQNWGKKLIEDSILNSAYWSFSEERRDILNLGQ